MDQEGIDAIRLGKALDELNHQKGRRLAAGWTLLNRISYSGLGQVIR